VSIDYVQQKLWEAMCSLVGPETIQERLRNARMSLSTIDAGDLTTFTDLRGQLNEIQNALRSGDHDAAAGAELSRRVLNLFANATRIARYPVGAHETTFSARDIN
jgi:hypothetical protein